MEKPQAPIFIGANDIHTNNAYPFHFCQGLVLGLRSASSPAREKHAWAGKGGNVGFLGVLLELRVANPTHVLEPGDEAGLRSKALPNKKAVGKRKPLGMHLAQSLLKRSHSNSKFEN